MTDNKNMNDFIQYLCGNGYVIDYKIQSVSGSRLIRAKVTLHRADGEPYDNNREWGAFQSAAEHANVYIHPDATGDKSQLHIVGVEHFDNVHDGLISLGEKLKNAYWVLQGNEDALKLCTHFYTIVNQHKITRRYFRRLKIPHNRPNMTDLKILEDYFDRIRALNELAQTDEYEEYFSSELAITKEWYR